LRGIEKESLRVGPDGALATTPHPAQLGSALTHPHITTDFSESQLELITGVHPDASTCLQELTEIHQFVFRHIGDDTLWSSSMPCRLPDDGDIPIGQYGTSNVGRLKTVYRAGLSRRYGRRMQAISGVHYNFSLAEGAMAELQAAADERLAAAGKRRRERAHLLDVALELASDFRLPLRLSSASAERSVGFPFRLFTKPRPTSAEGSF